jgi:hypothetical protein
MVISGIKNKYTQGAIKNKESIFANQLSIIFEPPLSLGIIHKKTPINVINTPMVIKPISELKKFRISFK